MQFSGFEAFAATVMVIGMSLAANTAQCAELIVWGWGHVGQGTGLAI